jgi:hypothetical protein
VIHAFDTADASSGRPRLDLACFSRFKHGSTAAAWPLATQVVARLRAECAEAVAAPRLVVTASCYKFLPLASVCLARVVAYLLNRERAGAGLPPVTWTQFYRAQLIEGDYSTMSLEERQRFIDQDVVRIDTQAVAGADVLVVDDLRITGFHEGRLATVLAAAGAAGTVFAYCSVLDGRGDPTVEQRMNRAAIGGLRELRRLIDAGGFLLNSRTCKLILSAPIAELPAFLGSLPPPVLAELAEGMECNGYAVMPRYRPAYELVRTVRAAGTQ